MRGRFNFRDHPGTPVMISLLALGGVVAQAWWGAVIMLVVFGPLYVYGAYDRAATTEGHDE